MLRKPGKKEGAIWLFDTHKREHVRRKTQSEEELNAYLAKEVWNNRETTHWRAKQIKTIAQRRDESTFLVLAQTEKLFNLAAIRQTGGSKDGWVPPSG